MSVDPLTEKYYSFSPYNYTMNNPINLIDPDGRSVESTIVSKNSDGSYTVRGGNASDGDNNIYVGKQNENGDWDKTDEIVGESLTSHSFFDEQGCAVTGAIIDPRDTSGQQFIDDEIISDDPNILYYMYNATGGQDYDFKDRGLKESGLFPILHRYRGSVASNGKFGSARDFGNGAAGIVAGRAGYSYLESRIGFDTLETFQKSGVAIIPGPKPILIITIVPTIEGTPTQLSQSLGYSIGQSLYNKDRAKNKKANTRTFQRFGE